MFAFYHLASSSAWTTRLSGIGNSSRNSSPSHPPANTLTVGITCSGLGIRGAAQGDGAKGKVLFNGEESVRIKTTLSRVKLEEAIEDSLSSLGPVESFGRGEFRISARKFNSFATEVVIDGNVSKGGKKTSGRCESSTA